MKIKFTKRTGIYIAATLAILIFFACSAARPLHNKQVNQADSTSSTYELQESSTTASGSSSKSENSSSSNISSQSEHSSSAGTLSSGQASNQVTTQPASKAAASGHYIVGYYTSWARNSGYTPDKINAFKLTHINYAFAGISSDLKLTLMNASTDIKNIQGLNNLKKKNPSLKIIISVGGWDESKRFSDAALTESSRETFAQSCLDFILKYKLDGVDLDWEYPVSGGIAGTVHRAQDKQNYTKLIRAIRQKLNTQNARDGKKYYVTLTGAPDNSFIKNTEPTALLPLIDYLFIMAYDMNGPWDQTSGYNAPLYSSTTNKFNVNQGIKNYLNAGFPAKKLVLGMPFYGYSYAVVGANNKGLNNVFTSAKSISYDSIASRYLNNSAYQSCYDETAMVPYLFGNNTFISYEDSASIAKKAKLAKKYGLAGVGAWELALDKNGTLLSSAYKALN